MVPGDSMSIDAATWACYKTFDLTLSIQIMICCKFTLAYRGKTITTVAMVIVKVISCFLLILKLVDKQNVILDFRMSEFKHKLLPSQSPGVTV